MSLMDAVKIEMDHRAKTRSMSEALMETLPKDPPRGSYYWWVKLCRQNTGSHFLDSGMAYGYRYNSPYRLEDMDPVTIQFWEAREATAYINLPHFLTEMFETDEVSEALQEVLDWVGTWLYPKEHWDKCIQEFPRELARLRECVWEYAPSGRKVFYKKSIREYIEHLWVGLSLYPHSGLMDFQCEMSEEEFVKEALSELPVKAVKLLEDIDRLPDEGTFYTYNNENDFNQDWLVDMWLEDGCEKYAVIRTHNGCDARGGFSSPVIVMARDPDYVWSWNVDVNCNNCEGFWEMMYFWGSEFGEGKSPKVPDIHKPMWDEGIPSQDALAILHAHTQHLEEGGDEEDFEAPVGLIDVDGEVQCPDQDGFDDRPAGDVRLLCPECGTYSVGVYNAVYGF